MTQIQQVGGVQNRDKAGAPPPGEIAYFNDGTAEFTGDGVHTAADAVGFYLNYLGIDDPALAAAAHNPLVIRLGAEAALQHNTALGITDPNQPIPKGKTIKLEEMSLKQLCAKAVELMEANGGAFSLGVDDLSRTVGQVRSHGLVIPTGKNV